MSAIVPYIAPPPSLPPPVGYPMTNGTDNPQQAAPPVHMQSKVWLPYVAAVSWMRAFANQFQ
ncbi:hypothetical protein Godav_010114 [Gossypium davidsonii]|uniref:Uncharacterized protein n=1 Tax=Gossypium davidsonii TaxID=34287 RepID=A0A7J8SFD7_GOSDV|nr:hypothetical protein [Gossypium davidsonii]